MHMNTRLFTRKEEETKLTVANNGWCHGGTLTNFLSSRLALELRDSATAYYLPKAGARGSLPNFCPPLKNS